METVLVPEKSSKHRQTPPKNGRLLYTPEPLRGRVIARHIGGQSNRRIAAEEKIDRETVSRILSQQEVTQMIEQYRAQLLAMVPKAIGVYDEALASDDLRIAATAATKLLEGFRVLSREPSEAAKPEPDHAQRKYLFLGQMMEGMLVKQQRYGISFFREPESIQADLKKPTEYVGKSDASDASDADKADRMG